MSGAVVLQTAWLGDVVLTTPLLTAAARRHARGLPDGRRGTVDVVTTPAAAPLVETHPAVRQVIPFDKRGADRGIGGLLRLARTFRRSRYAVAYLPQPSLRSGLAALLAGIPERVGFADAPARFCYTRRVPRDPGRHEAERLVALADPRASSALELHLTDADRAAAEAALARTGIAGVFVAVAPDSARATKRWPHFAELAARLGEEIPVFRIDGTRPIRVSAAVLARATVAVTNDSAPLHLAQAVGTPTVALFGPTTPDLGFGPRGRYDRTVGIELPCRPCSTHGGTRCPLGHHRCMRDLSVETVLDVVRNVLATVPAVAAAPRGSGTR